MGKIHPDERMAILIGKLRNARRRIMDLASQLDTSQREEVYLGSWSPREMLAHLAGWDDANRRAAAELIAGQVPSFYQFSGKDWAAYNARLVAEYSRTDFDELLSLVIQFHQALLRYIEEIPAAELWHDRGIRVKGWKVTIGRLLEVETVDEEEHFSQLEEFAAKKL